MIPFINKINQVAINPLIKLVIAIAVVYFIYSIINLIIDSRDGKELKDSKNAVFYSLIGIFIMVSVYGIINFILSSISERPPAYLENKLKGQ